MNLPARPKKRCKWLLLSMLVAALIASRPQSAIAQKQPAKKATGAAAIPVPKNALVFATLKVASFWNGPEKASLRKIAASHPVIPIWFVKNMKKQLGITASEIERVSMIAPAPNTSFLFVLTTRKPYDRDKVVQLVTPDAKEEKIQGKRYFTSGKGDYAVYPVNKNTLVIGMARSVSNLLKEPIKKGQTLKSRLQKVSKDALLVVDITPAFLRQSMQKAAPQVKPYLPLAEATSWQVEMNVSDGLEITLEAEFADKKTAAKALPAMKKAVSGLDDILSMSLRNLPPFFKMQEKKYPGVKVLAERWPEAIKAARAGIQKVRVEQKGTTAQATIPIETRESVVTAVLLLALAPRPATKK